MNKIISMSALIACLGSNSMETVKPGEFFTDPGKITNVEVKETNLAVNDSEKSSQNNTNVYCVKEKNTFKHIKCVGQKSLENGPLIRKNGAKVVAAQKTTNRPLRFHNKKQSAK